MNISSAFTAAARLLGIQSAPPKPAGDMSRYLQPLELIPGMPAASEPCALAQKWTPLAHPRAASGQEKVDGIRALALCTRIVSREALPLDCALHCLPALVELEARYGQPMVFDGEYQEPEGFEATLAAHKRGEGKGTFWIFDAVPYAEWKTNRFNDRWDVRVPRMVEMVEKLEAPFVQALPPIPLADAADAERKAAEIWARGGEGLVVKRNASIYERGRTHDWLKLKRVWTLDGVIRDLVIKDGRVIAMLIAIGGVTTVKVGSAIPEHLRTEMARQPDAWTGRIVEVAFNERTDAGKLRGGYFVRMRDDRSK